MKKKEKKPLLHSAVSLSAEDTVRCSGTARNDVNLNLTHFQPMGVVRLQFYQRAGRCTRKLMLSSESVAESQLQIPPLSPVLCFRLCVDEGWRYKNKKNEPLEIQRKRGCVLTIR